MIRAFVFYWAVAGVWFIMATADGRRDPLPVYAAMFLIGGLALPARALQKLLQ